MNKIDFTLVITAENCNPNGDIDSLPRTTAEGHGVITDVCIKRKLRNYLHDTGESIIVLMDSQVTDGRYSIMDRINKDEKLKKVAATKNPGLRVLLFF